MASPSNTVSYTVVSFKKKNVRISNKVNLIKNYFCRVVNTLSKLFVMVSSNFYQVDIA